MNHSHYYSKFNSRLVSLRREGQDVQKESDNHCLAQSVVERRPGRIVRDSPIPEDSHSLPRRRGGKAVVVVRTQPKMKYLKPLFYVMPVLLPVLIKWKVLADEDSWRTYPHPIRNVNTLQTFIKKKLNEKNDQFVRDDEDFRGIIYNNRSQNAVTMLDPDPSSIKNTIIVTNEANSDEDAQIKEDECLDGWVTRPEKLGVRAGQILNHLGVPSFALVTQCEAGWVLVTTRLLLQEAGEKGVSSCLFDSVSSMKKAVMTSPYDARCFSRRQWTVVLLGGHTWASDLIHSTSNLRFYDQRVHWVVVGSAGVITSTLAQYHHTQRVTWLRWSSRARDWVVLVSKATAQGLVAREAGRWVESGQHTHFRVSRPLTPPFPTNFFHSPLRVVSRHPTDQKLTPNSVGRCYYAKEDGRNITKCTGYVGEMLMLLTQDLNLTIVNSLVHSCGVSTANGTRVTVISYGEADIALGTCTITTDRLKVVDFTEFFAAIRSTIASAEPALVQSPFLIFNVLSSFTWMVVAVYVLVVTVVVWVVARILGSVDHHYASSVTHAFALIFKANLFQAHSHQPWSVSVRAVVAVSWVGVITVAGVYSGNLTAWLSLPRYEKPVDSLADLVTRPDLMPIVSLNDPNHQMFQNQTEGSLGVIRKRLVVWNNSSGTERMRAIIYQKHVAMNSDRSHISRATALNKVEGRLGFAPCRIHLGRQDVRQDFLGLMINKNSWFKEQMNERIRWLRSYGIIQYLYKQFNQPGCRVRKTGEQREFSNSLTLWQLEGVYWVWLVGAATSTFALLMELFLANYVDKCDHHH
ncbi:uncharacterized protein LOC121858546 [Homarus americanus]|uniref:uncharacterized protein LOC121858546 n=1 Tax=Homarus americanus TaxID=6706 RepID=UPI001C48154F|nr:uncharacterized protein LOC121858546 [Homarus americanus]